MKSPILLAVASTLIFSITAKASILDDFSSNSSADYNTIDAFATAGSFGISNNEFAPSEASGFVGTTYFLRNTGEFLSASGGQSVSIEIIQTGTQQVTGSYIDAAGLGFSTSPNAYQYGNELLLAKESPGHSELGSLGYTLTQTTNGFSLDNGPATLTVTRETSNPTLFDYVLTGGGLSQPAAQGTLSYPASAGLPVYFGMAASYNTTTDSSNSVREDNLTFSGSPVTNSPNIVIQNSSFEAPDVTANTAYFSYLILPTNTGWMFSANAPANSGIAKNGSGLSYWQAIGTTNGNQYAWLEAKGGMGASMSQTISNFPTGTYSFTFTAAQRSTYPTYPDNSQNQTVTVLVDGSNVGSFTPPDQNWYSYTTTPIQLNAGNHTLSFTNLPVAGDATILIDAVGVQQTNSTNISPSSDNLPTNGLVSLWSAEGNGLDSFGTNNATVSSGMTYAPGEIGQAFDFDGTSNSMVTIPASDSLNVGAGEGITLSCWIYPTSANVPEPLMEWEGSNGIPYGTHFWISTSPGNVTRSGNLFVNFLDTAGNVHYFYTQPSVIQAGVIQHVAATYDKASGVGNLYYNGSNVATQYLGTFTPKTDTPLLLGQRIFTNALNQAFYYQGLMDEVSVYNRALSAQEIQELATNQPVITNAPTGTNPQFISPFSFIPNQIFGVSPFSITPPTSSSSLSVLLSVLSGPATISGDTVTINGAGTVVLAADQTGNTNYAGAPEVTTSFRVAQATQTISPFVPISQQALTEQSFDITQPTASSGLPVAVIVKGGPATISGNTVTLQGTGLVYLAADQSGDSNYSAAPEVITSFLVKASYQDFTTPFNPPPNKTYGDAPFRIVPPKIDSHLPVKISVLSGPAKISGDLVTITGVGNVILAADQPGTDKYTTASEITTSFYVFPASQTIKLPRIPTKKPGEVVELPKNASSGLPITYSIVMASPDDINLITLSENKVSLTSKKQLKGDIQVVIAANQSGNLNYRPAVGQTVTITFKR